MKVLISGGAGFIGSHVTEELLEQGYEVVIIDNLTTGFTRNMPSGVSFYQFNLDDPRIEYVFEKEKPTLVIHLAAQASVSMSMRDPYLDFFTNTAGTLKLLLLAKKYQVRKFLFASTAAVYGDPLYLPIDEKHLINPQSYYAQSKLSAENYIKLYDILNGLDSCILRFSNVYGPRQNPEGEAGVISIFINRMLRRKSVLIYDGTQTRDFIYVKDVAKACRLALESDQKGVFNISSGVETTINELYALLAEAMNCSDLPNYEPLRPGELSRSVLDNRKAQMKLNWKIQHTLKKGLRETVLAYQKGMITTDAQFKEAYKEKYSITNYYI